MSKMGVGNQIFKEKRLHFFILVIKTMFFSLKYFESVFNIFLSYFCKV